MVDISDKLEQIKKLIDNEFYFTINKLGNMGKLLQLSELKNYFKNNI